MKKKRIVIAIVCIALSALLICGLFAAGFAYVNANGFQFGGLVGELMAGKDKNALDTDATDTKQHPTTQEQISHETSYEDATEPVPPDPGGSPTLRFFLGGCESWIQYNKVQDFFEAGKALEWDFRAVIDDYKVEYVRIWGWAALFRDVPLQLGYRIDGGESVYDGTAEFYEPAQSSTTAALGMGAVSAIGMRINVPVEHLSGTHTVEIVIRQSGADEGVICTFEIEKAEPPYVFIADAAYLANMLESGQSKGIESFKYFFSFSFVI